MAGKGLRLEQRRSGMRRTRDQDRAANRFRAEQGPPVFTAKGEVGGRHAFRTAPHRHGFGAVIELPHITQAGIAYEQVALAIDRQAVRAAWAVRREELAHLADAAV